MASLITRHAPFDEGEGARSFLASSYEVHIGCAHGTPGPLSPVEQLSRRYPKCDAQAFNGLEGGVVRASGRNGLNSFFA
jgi:hypothetical protein